MANRLTRDELCQRALNQIDSSALDAKDRPHGTALHPNAITIEFLQNGLDYFHSIFPWTGLVAKTAVTLTAGDDEYAITTVAPRYILDVRDGLRIIETGTKRRVYRKPLTWLLNRDPEQTGTPQVYSIYSGLLRVWPVPDRTYTGGEFWHYQLPPALAADDIPNFPDDWTLIEYVVLRGKSWAGEVPPDSAMEYCKRKVADLQKSGLGNEAIEDSLGLDPTVFAPTGTTEGSGSPWGWMGAR